MRAVESLCKVILLIEAGLAGTVNTSSVEPRQTKKRSKASLQVDTYWNGKYRLEVTRQGNLFGSASVSLLEDYTVLWSLDLDQWPKHVTLLDNGSVFWVLYGSQPQEEVQGKQRHFLKLCFYDVEGYLSAMHSMRHRSSNRPHILDVPNISRVMPIGERDLLVGLHIDKEKARRELWTIYEMDSGRCVRVIDPTEEFDNLLFIDNMAPIGNTPLFAILWACGTGSNYREKVSVWSIEQGEVFSEPFTYGGRNAKLMPSSERVIMVVPRDGRCLPDGAGVSLEVYEASPGTWAARQL